MKKLILFLIAFISISIMATAQSGKTASFETYYYVEYTGGGTDSTINLVDISTKVYYRYLNVLVTQTATEAKISNLKISLKK